MSSSIDFQITLTSSSESFSSGSVKRFDPVTSSRIDFLDDGGFTTSGQKTLFGNPVPNSDHLNLEVVLFGKAFNLRFTVSPLLLTEDAYVNVHSFDEHGVETVSHEAHELASYKAQLDGGWASLTLRKDGLYHLALFDGIELYQVDPVELHAQFLSKQHFAALSSASRLVAFRMSDVDHSNESCGVDQLEGANPHEHEHDHVVASVPSQFKLDGDFSPIPRMAGMPSVTQEMVQLEHRYICSF